ncbi:MAG: zf-TFIIB domain-containing protein [Deltaproteobacteria bacterium]|jgi:Zn-finger nucleic acid-binding protein|nr:zf-TFIIB domain-containing protein [Deltaproteobacteria bacterium]MBW2532396.1 zf-TFIIB domain-containing protein [Deltaproteobacteria bacterium]
MDMLETTPQGSERSYRVDRCSGCGGLWLDQGELREICPTLSDLPERHLEVECLGARSTHLPTCPRCSARPYSFRVVDLEIDCCTQCGGAWLDEVEHEEIARGLDPSEQARPGRFQRDPYRAMRSAAQQGRARCARCSATEPLSETFMTAGGLICERCLSAQLADLDDPADFSPDNAAELGERFRPTSWLERLMAAIAGLS